MVREIEIYVADIELWKPIIRRELSGEQRTVSTATIERAERFLKIDDAYRSVGAELLRNQALRRATGGEPIDLCIVRDEYGKPRLADYPDIHFNISHSGQLILCAIDCYPVGVDIEMMRPIDPDVAESCFTPNERKRLQGTDSEEFLVEFYRLWTLKESYLKRLGTGLHRNPLSVEIIPLDLEERMWGTEDDSIMECLEAPGGYAAAVCGKREYRCQHIVLSSGEVSS